MEPYKYIIDHAELSQIWLDKGPHPKHHDEVKAWLAEQWPGLYKYIDDVVRYPKR